MLIILEGADCTGKSTLAGLLVKAANDRGMTTRLLHAGPPPEHDPIDEHWPGRELWRSEYVAPLEKLRPLVDSPTALVVCDRWHLGERIYGPMLRGRSIMTYSDGKEMSAWLKMLGALIVILIADDATIEDRYEMRGDPLVSLRQATQANARYLLESRRDARAILTTSDAKPIILIEAARESLREAAGTGSMT
jgi:thymidylate kinase